MATQAEGKSLSELEREAEHTRADLIHTVDELHNRVSPHAIKEEMKAYARDTGNELNSYPRTEGPRKPNSDGSCCGRIGVSRLAFLDQYPRAHSIGRGRLGPYPIRRVSSCDPRTRRECAKPHRGEGMETVSSSRTA